MKAGNEIRIQAKLQNVQNGDILAAMVVSGQSEDDIFAMSDSLTKHIKDFLEIDVLKQLNPNYDRDASGTRSAEAYRYFIQGMDAHYKPEPIEAFTLLSKAVEIDSNFIEAAVYLNFQHFLVAHWTVGVEYLERLYKQHHVVPPKYQYMMEVMKAALKK